MADTKASEKDIVAQNEKLTAELAKARLDLEASNKLLSDANISLTTVTTERDAARTALITANQLVATRDGELKTANTKITELSTDIEGKVAAKVAELGVRTQAMTQPKAGAAVVPGLAGAAAKTDANGKVIPVNFTELCAAHIADHGKIQITTEKPATPK